MQKVLLLEDIYLTRETLKRLLRKKFPWLTIEAARDEGEARTILEKCAEEKDGLYAAILDLKVPPTENAYPDVSSICADVHSMFPGAVVGHITAHNDEDIQTHLDLYHLKSGVPVFLVHKGDDDGKWHRRVVSELAGAPIERSLPVLRQGSVPQSSMPRQASQRHQSGTFLRAALVRDIRQNWKLLEPELKDRIKRYFTVDENHDPVIVR